MKNADGLPRSIASIRLLTSAGSHTDGILACLAERAAGDLLAPPDNDPFHQWLTTGDPQGFTFLARRFLGPEVDQVHQASVDLGAEEHVRPPGQRATSEH